MSVNVSLNQIGFQSALRSKPVRENFADTENSLNDLQSQINLLATPPAGTEVTNARDYHSVLRDRMRSESAVNGNVLISGGVVSEQAVPDMTVHIAAGEAIVDGVACKWAAQDSGTITAPGTNTRLDYVVVNSDNSISIVAGTSGASPVFPSFAASQLPVSALVVKAATTSMNDGAEIFQMSNGGDLYYPNVYVNADTTLTENLNYNNLIIDGVKFDTAGFSALCQGTASIVSVTNDAVAAGPQVYSSKPNKYGNPSAYVLTNYKGDVLSAGVASGNDNALKAGSGNNGFNLSIKALNIYNYGSISAIGYDGVAGTNDLVLTSSYGATGEDGGDGGAGGTITLSAIIECSNNGTITTTGGEGANGRSCSAGSQINLGGASGRGGDGGDVTLSGLSVTAGTISSVAGGTGSVGTGSGGAVANANGTSGGGGTNGTETTSEYNSYTPRPSDFASWIVRIK